ncbi:NAD(P)H-dependent oxidoreductase [Actinomycetes bacterium M1A6_2h]
MHLLTVYCHPRRDSYAGAVMDAFHQPFERAGHTVDILDLDREGFDPRFTQADDAHFWGGPLPADISHMQSRVMAADRLAFVFPVYWWSMPALMKGWIERVFTPGWAYRHADVGSTSTDAVLPQIPTLLMGIAGSTQRNYDKYGYRDAMRTQLDVGVFSYCRLDDVESHFVYDVEDAESADNRAEGLQTAHRIGAMFGSHERQPRRAREDHLRWVTTRATVDPMSDTSRD